MRFLKIPSCLLLIPILIAAQDQRQLPPAARKLLKHPQFGKVRLTQSGHAEQRGTIQRVTTRFVTFFTESGACENIDMKNLIDVEPYPKATTNHGTDFLGDLVFVAVLAPFVLAAAAAEPFRSLFPPMHPLSGIWESDNHSPENLYFSLNHVSGVVTTMVRRGRYSVDQGKVRLTSESGTEVMIPFRFDCSFLRLDGGRMSLNPPFSRVTEPIVGEWHDANRILSFKPDGTFAETKSESRGGTFEMFAEGATIRWANKEEWTARIKRRHLEIVDDGAVVKYRYHPGDLFYWDF